MYNMWTWMEKCAEEQTTQQGVYTISILDSNEEDTHSYILNKEDASHQSVCSDQH
jgi:hypothetical protein